jgi:CheY-like chemotaxis protein
MSSGEEPSPRDRLQGLRVLIAEDEPMISLVLEDMLGDLGCHVAGSATTLAQTLDLGATASFDIAILDVSLARENVDSAAQAIAARGIPVVLATGHLATDVAARLGAASVVQKPYTTEALRDALIEALPRV